MALKIKKFKIVICLMLLISIIPLVSSQCDENWQCLSWQRCISGISERRCFDLNSCGTMAEKPAETADCRDVLPYCYDKILNQDESGTDCGGKICIQCALGKACLRDEDCYEGSCIKGKCAIESGAPAPAVIPASEIVSAILIIFAIAIIIMVMKKLKRRKIIVLVNKKEGIKEEIKKFIPAKSMVKKKNKLAKFTENFNGYLSSLKPQKSQKTQKIIENTEKKKDLLNKSPYKKQPVKEFMLGNIKEVYNG